MIKEKIKYNKTLKWIIEIGIWFLVFVSIASVIILIRNDNNNSYSTYQIFLPDVDGIITGSPVRMMGVPIGYITQVNIIADEVFVKFRLTQKGLQLPKGSVVTVEFSGLGGSKSLEIYPNEKILNKEEYLIVQPPKRIHDSAGLMYDMFEKMSSISYRTSSFMKRMTKMTIPKNISDKDAKTILNDCDKWLDNTTKKIENLEKKQKEIIDGR